MRILFVCAAGMSTSLIVKSLSAYCSDHGLSYEINAVGINEYEYVYKDYDVILLAPQVRYKLTEIQQRTCLPCEPIPSFDYAVGNCAHMILLAEKLCAQK